MFIFVGTPWYIYRICYDLNHPEIWDEDWTNDPRIFLPYIAAVGAFIVFDYRRLSKRRRKGQAEMKELEKIMRDLGIK